MDYLSINVIARVFINNTFEIGLAPLSLNGRVFAWEGRCDVSNRNEVLEAAAKVKAEVGDVTVLVNNAGIMPCHPLPGHKSDEIRKIFDVNVLAHFWVC